MKEFSLLFLLFNICICSYSDCIKERDTTKCSSIGTTEEEYKNWKCVKTYNQNDPSHPHCTYFPINENAQNIFSNIEDGESKEENSKSPNVFYTSSSSSKQIYEINNKNIEINFSVTNKDIQIQQNKNTCAYISFGQYYEKVSECERTKDSSECKIKYEGVKDKNKCFNADQFDDLKNLINCGFAQVKISFGGEEKTTTLCSYIPTENLHEDILQYFKYRYIDKIIIDDLEEIIEDDLIGRRLETEIIYEMLVEDKDGNKVKYTSENYKVEKISNDESTTEANPKDPNNGNNIKFLFFKILFAFLLL
jgi:hypothetical protein